MRACRVDPNVGLDTRRVKCPTRLMDVQLADFVTIGLLVLLEGLLSADNALVLAVLVLGLPQRQQKALRYGIVGAFAFRTLATLLAVYLIQRRLGEAGRRGLPALSARSTISSGAATPRRAASRQTAQAVAGPVGLLGDGPEGRADRLRLRDRLDPRGRGDVAEALGRSSPAAFSASSRCAC